MNTGRGEMSNKVIKVTTKLKCKPCGLFYKDNATIANCEKCGNELKQIKVHHVKIKSLKLVTKKPTVGA
jgi:Zn finger protein HypA/HybF involved in hydrogenase expression